MIKRHFHGVLDGDPAVVSIDRTGERADRDRCAYVAKDCLLSALPAGYRLYIIDTLPTDSERSSLREKHVSSSLLYNFSGSDALCNYDVAEITSDGYLHLLYRDRSSDNVLFITNQCNSNCIMCPDPEVARIKPSNITKDFILWLIELIPGDARFLTITGGEPTLLKWDLVDILQKCRDHFERASFLFLTNGRSFSDDRYRETIIQNLPERIRLGIPLHASEASLHDQISGIQGSFAQTTYALSKLQSKVSLEIRVVVSKLNYKYLSQIAEYIAKHFPLSERVCYMGMELLGSAALRRDRLWVDYLDTADDLDSAAKILLSAGIDMKIYNYPLCGLPEHLWSLAHKSISDYKVSFREECEQCTVKKMCGGLFSSDVRYSAIQVHPIQGGISQ